VPGIHVVRATTKAWMAGTSPTMTSRLTRSEQAPAVAIRPGMRMPGSAVYGFGDPADYQDGLRSAGIDLVVTCQGEFKADVTRVDLHHVHLLRCHEELARLAFVSLQPHLVFATFPTDPGSAMTWGTRDVRHGDIVFHGRGERFHQRVPAETRWGSIALSQEHLVAYGRALAGRDPIPPRFGAILHPPRRIVTRLLRLHAQAARLAERRPRIVMHSEIARALEHDLIPAVIQCLTTGTVEENTPAMQSRAAIMVGFEEVLAARGEGPLHMPELCATIGVSEQALRSCCKEFIGLSPIQYLRRRRLELVHTALRRADPRSTSITDLAGRYGFSAPARFAHLYRKMFGETPSATLRRASLQAVSEYRTVWA